MYSIVKANNRSFSRLDMDIFTNKLYFFVSFQLGMLYFMLSNLLLLYFLLLLLSVNRMQRALSSL